MEQCMARPEVKKKKTAQPRPQSTPPKPPKHSPELSGNRPETQRKENPVKTPAAPLKPSDVANMNRIQRVKETTAQTPVIPPRPTEKELSNTVSFRRYQTTRTQDNQLSKEKDPEFSEIAKEETDFRQGKVAMLTQMFQKGPNEEAPTFISYVSDSNSPKPKEKTEAEKPTTENKKGGLKGMLKSNLLKSQTSVETTLSAEEPEPERDQSGDEVELERPKEGKHGKGGFMAGMFRGIQKEKTTAPLVRVSPANSDTENAEEAEPVETKVKGGMFSGMFKKPRPSQDVTLAQDNLSVHSDLSVSDDDSLSDHNVKGTGGVLTRMFKKAPKSTNTQAEEETGILTKSPKPSEDGGSREDFSVHRELSASNDSLSEKKGGLFSGIFKKAPKATDEENRSLHEKLSASNDSLSEHTNTKKGGMLGGMFKKSPKSTEISPAPDEDKQPSNDELSRSTDDLSENSSKEKGNVFSGLFRKPQKRDVDAPFEEDKQSLHGELSASEDNLSDKPKEKSGIFGVILKKSPKPPEEDKGAQDKDSLSTELSASTDDLSENTKPKEKGGVFGGMFKKPKLREGSDEDKDSLSSELSASTDDLSENTKPKEKGGVFGGMFKKPKPRDGSDEDKDLLSTELSASTDDLLENTRPKEKGGVFGGMFKKPKPHESCLPDEDNAPLDKNLSASNGSLSDNITTTKEKTTGLSGMFRRSPKPVLKSQASTDPLTQFSELSESNDSLAEISSSQAGLLSVDPELSGSKDDLSDNNNTKEKKGMLGIFRRSPRPAEQAGADKDGEDKGLVRRGRSLKKKQRVVSFRVKRTLPRVPKISLGPSARSTSQECLIEEPLELQEMPPVQEATEVQVEIQEVEMAAYPTEGNPLEAEGEGEGLMDWWRTVEGWDEWNETKNFQADEEEEAVEEVADRVFMAARLFVHLFNQRGALLQQRILELLAQADAVDHFHKKTVSAAIGGGVASVAGSVATITGLILAPFTFGASIIVTAVGISVATAGSITSATANITDTVHAKMDRNKVEKMIQGYQDEIKDIRECMEFVQEGMHKLEEWDFEKYSESVAKKHLHHNIKHVMKEGGRAGKALMVNTDKLISTFQVLGAAGGVAKAAQAISITTGVMSALFLALDVFFLARDSHELRKGAKTKFATKIREMCKELQDGLLELNKVKSQLQKTMDGIEVEAYEEEGEEEDEDEDEEDLESDPVKLAQLEQELDQLEEKLDMKIQEQPSKGMSKKGETEKEMKSEKGREKETKSEKEKKNKGEKKEGMTGTKSEIIEEDRRSVKSEGREKEGVKEKQETEEEEKVEKAEAELIGEIPKEDAEMDASTKSNTKERDLNSEKGDLVNNKKDRAMEKVKEERPTRRMHPIDKHNQSQREEEGSVRSLKSSEKEKSMTERAALRDEKKMTRTREEDEANKGKARSEKGSKSEIERATANPNDGHRRREEHGESRSQMGSETDVDIKGGKTVTKPKQERGVEQKEERGGKQKEERGGELRDSTKRRDGEREVRGERFSKQEGGTNRGHRSEQGEGRCESLVGRKEADNGRRREREGERRGSTQKYGSERGGGEGKRESGQDHTGVKGRNVKELDGENQRSSQEYGSERGGGKGRRGSGQEYSSEKRRSGSEWDSSRRSDREARERTSKGKGERPEPNSHGRSIHQDDLSI